MTGLLFVLAVLYGLLEHSDASGDRIGDILLARRPDLGIYQDITWCLHKGSQWYVVYRNTEHGNLGNDDRCLKETQLTDLVDGKAVLRFHYGPGHETNVTFTFTSSEGQTHRNYLDADLDGAPTVPRYEVLFADCSTCYILKLQGGVTCILYAPESGLRKSADHCHFLFDLLCGPSPKYPVSDASCLADTKTG